MVLAAALLVGAAPDLCAQGVFGGIRTGVAFANATFGGDPGIATEDVNSLMLGGALQVSAGSVFGVRAELGYSERGFKVAEENGTSAVSLQYLTLPIVTDFTLPLGPISPHVYTGPAASLQIGCSVGAGNAALTLFGADCSASAANVKGFDFGWVFGGGLVIRTGAPLVFLDLGYDLGLTDVTGNAASEVKNTAVSFSVAMMFPLGA
jgi:Outer membrane protein beta-barrel domain